MCGLSLMDGEVMGQPCLGRWRGCFSKWMLVVLAKGSMCKVADLDESLCAFTCVIGSLAEQ